MAFGYPIILDVTKLPIVIVGGGQVALRKAVSLLDSGATAIVAVAPCFHPDFPAGVRQTREAYRSEHLADVRVVFAATDDAGTNDQVVRDAHVRGLLVNRVDHEGSAEGDFTVPAVHRDGSLLIAVATGHSPALSAELRNRLAKAVDPGWARLAEYSEAIRPRILAMSSLGPDGRREIFRLLASEEAMRTARDGDIDRLWNWLCTRHSQLGRA
jgi:precorrin-2 dehydrogenase / sirohydrochlorin ferrochelatase